MPSTVRLHRVLSTRPEKVYRAFLEADALAKWLPPNGFACTVHHLEPKVGGTFKMSFRNFTTGNGHSFGGEYVELVPNERLCYTDKFDDPSLAGEIVVTGDVEESVGRHGARHRAGRHPGRHSAGGLLSRLAGVVAKPGKTRGARNQSIAHKQSSRRRPGAREAPIEFCIARRVTANEERPRLRAEPSDKAAPHTSASSDGR